MHFRVRCYRTPNLTAPVAIEAAAAWRSNIPETGRLAIETRVGTKSLHVRELRLSKSSSRDFAWAEGHSKPGLGLVLVSLTVEPKRFEFRIFHLAIVSLHALGRRFQRGFDNSEAAIHRDLLTIAMAADGITTAEFEIKLPGGAWLGRVMEMLGQADKSILSVRTFLAA